MPKSRPIIMGADSVRAILEGRKTQTRRVVKQIPALGEPDNWCHKISEDQFQRIVGDYRRYAPHGQAGDELWVRESYCRLKVHCEAHIMPGHCEEWWAFVEPGKDPEEDSKTPPIWFLADGDAPETEEVDVEYGYQVSPLFLPREWSRLTLRITDVRVERLQEISEEDAFEEGHPEIDYSDPDSYFPRLWFAHHWDSINGAKHPWESNPWVWVYEFERIDNA